LDVDSVFAIGEKYLSAGDKIDIANAGDDAAETAYRKCLRAILDSGTEDAKELQAKIDASKQKPASYCNLPLPRLESALSATRALEL
jgi:hypothetical protein